MKRDPRYAATRYPQEWPQIALRVKTEADWRCIRCGHPNSLPDRRVLTVHHLDGNKANCEWWNLAALCQRCHLSIQGRVVMERAWLFEHSAWFWPYVAGYYAHACGLPTTRGYVMKNLERMLEMGG